MPHVVFSPCLGVKDQACFQVCPVECYFDAGPMLVIHPEECIDCGACVSECPVEAIQPADDVPATPVPEEKQALFREGLPHYDVPKNETDFTAFNANFFEGKSDDEIEDLRMKA